MSASLPPSRIRFLRWFFLGVVAVFGVRLFQLQVLDHEQYLAEAKEQHLNKSILPARRGKIYVKKNRLSDELTPLATNNTLKMLFVDPVVINYPKFDPNKDLSEQERGDPRAVAELLAPLLIHAHCEVIDGCEIKIDQSEWSDTERTAISAYAKELERILTEVEVRKAVIATEVAASRLQEVSELGLAGVYIDVDSVWVNPTEVEDRDVVAEQLSELLNQEADDIKYNIRRRPRRYIEVIKKIIPEVSDRIENLKQDERYKRMLRGVVLADEHWRYYPEKELASQIVGFVDHAGNGQYGVEERFDQELKGNEGHIFGATNADNQFISAAGGSLGIEQAEDGVDVVLSIDRMIQGEVERILQDEVDRYKADSGQVLVVEPKTGKILAMAHAPSFDPNEFARAYQRYEISPEQAQANAQDQTFNRRIPTIENEGKYFRYYNTWGPDVFRNKIITDPYEPGSVMKALTVAAGINSNEITPRTLYDDDGPIEVANFRIRNADNIYAGLTTIVTGLIKSRNTMIAYVTKKMGSQLWHKYLVDWGFGEPTDIPLDGESGGRLEHWQTWDETELITRGFGQGVSVTPLQMVMAFASLANGGDLMEPILIEKLIHPDGREEVKNPRVVRKVINDEAYQQTKAMLLTSVQSGYAEKAQVPGYNVAGKTGTSQTYRNGRALRGVGTTIASFGGFGPVKDPQFVVLVKFDYTKTSPWGSDTAAVTFRRIASFLFDHMGIPPDFAVE